MQRSPGTGVRRAADPDVCAARRHTQQAGCVGVGVGNYSKHTHCRRGAHTAGRRTEEMRTGASTRYSTSKAIDACSAFGSHSGLKTTWRVPDANAPVVVRMLCSGGQMRSDDANRPAGVRLSQK